MPIHASLIQESLGHRVSGTGTLNVPRDDRFCGGVESEL